jgi:hypothetical protein
MKIGIKPTMSITEPITRKILEKAISDEVHILIPEDRGTALRLYLDYMGSKNSIVVEALACQYQLYRN